MAPQGPDPSAAGPLVLAKLFLNILFGMLSVQVYLYSLAFQKDKPLIKTLVYGVYIVILAQTIFSAHDAYRRDTSQSVGAGLGWFFVPVLGGIAGLAVQAFYAWRIYKLSDNRVVSISIGLLAFFSNLAAFISAGFGSKIEDVSNLNASASRGVRICSAVWYTGSAVCDIIIAVYMIYLLTRNGTGMGNTRAVVQRIVRLTIETNTLTTTVAVLTAILLLAFPGKTYWTAPSLFLPSLYANTLLVMLNLRLRVARVQDSDTDRTMSLPSFVAASPAQGGQLHCAHCNRSVTRQSQFVVRTSKKDLERISNELDAYEHSEDIALQSFSRTGVAR